MKKSYTFEIVIRKEASHPGFYALCPALPGCFSNGQTVEETESNMYEAIQLHLEGLREDGEEILGDENPLLVHRLQVAI